MSEALACPCPAYSLMNQWHGRRGGRNGMRLRWWRPAEDVPDWATGRLVQALFLLCIGILIGGIIALDYVRLDPLAFGHT